MERASATSSLPGFRSGFVGRASELTALRDRLESGTPWIALTGPPTVGKSRLAVEAAQRWQRAAEGRAWAHADLSGAAGLDDVIGTLADALGLVAPIAGFDPIDAFVDAVADRPPTVVVLDACENVSQLLGRALSAWTTTTPLQFLTTARVPVRGEGASLFEVSPLALDDAVDLFVLRAKGAGGRVEVSDRDDVAMIVEALDRLPLSVELAAARTRIMRPRDVRERLDRDAGVLARHALDQALEASLEPLGAVEQRVLAACTAFRGGFDMAAAEAVLPVPPGTTLVDVLQSLRDRCLLGLVPNPGNATRFTVLDVVRHFVAKQAGAGVAIDDAQARHADYYLGHARVAADAHFFHAEPAARSFLHREFDNIVMVAERGLAADSAAGVTQALRALYVLLVVAFERRADGYFRLVDRALLRARELDVSEAECAPVLMVRAWKLLSDGQMWGCRAAALEAEAMARAVGDSLTESMSAFVRSFTELTDPLGVQALDTLAASVAASERSGSQLRVGRGLSVMGYARFLAGDADAAVGNLQQALSIHQSERDPVFEGATTERLAWIAMHRGHFAEAETLCHRALASLEKAAYGYPERALGYLVLGSLTEQRGDFGRALEHYDHSVAILRGLGAWPYLGIALGVRAACYQGRGDIAAAQRDFQEAVRVCSVSVPGHAALYGAQLAALNADRGRLEEATRLIHEAEQAETFVGVHYPAQVVAYAQGHLDLADARAREARGDANGARTSTERAAAAAAIEPTAGLPTSQYARVARRLLRRALGMSDAIAPADEPSPPTTETAEPTPTSLALSRAADRFCVPGGTFVHLPARSAQQRILLHLAQLHRSDAHAPLETLIEVGWPGERTRYKSGRARVYVVLSTLRDLGLRAVLRRDRNGYFIAPEVALEWT